MNAIKFKVFVLATYAKNIILTTGLFTKIFGMNKFRNKFSKISSFTLVEMLFVILILGLLLPSMITLITYLSKSHREISVRQSAIQESYGFVERLNVLLQDYTIDYEEYFNRRNVGCTTGGGYGDDFKRLVNSSGYCSTFTAYGNENTTNRKGLTSTGRDIYYCSSKNDQDKGGQSKVVNLTKCGKAKAEGARESFGQYAATFIDVGGDTDGVGGIVGDSDDMDQGYQLYKNSEISAIGDPSHIQELYFISHDGKNRLYFRRKLVSSTENFLQYKIQMLRLKGFDAGRKHNFSDTSSGNVGLYDGVIDTWACDYEMGYVGNGQSINGIYSGYKLPKDENDCWIDLTQGGLTVTALNATMSPVIDPELEWAKQDKQINPYMTLLVVFGVYPPYYAGKLSSTISEYKVPIETTINMKDFYKN